MERVAILCSPAQPRNNLLLNSPRGWYQFRGALPTAMATMGDSERCRVVCGRRRWRLTRMRTCRTSSRLARLSPAVSGSCAARLALLLLLTCHCAAELVAGVSGAPDLLGTAAPGTPADMDSGKGAASPLLG